MLTNTERQERASATIATLYETHRRPVRDYLARLVYDRTIAEDLCQETFLKALRSWDEGTQVANRVAWLYRIATNTAYDELRRRRKIRFVSLDAAVHPPTGTPAMESRFDEQEPVQRVLAQLPDQSRRLLVLRACAGHSTGELAAALACSHNALRLRLFRARQHFREAYLALAGERALLDQERSAYGERHVE